MNTRFSRPPFHGNALSGLRRALRLGFAGLLSLGALAVQAAPQALLIGIGEFAHKSIPALPGTANDLVAMQDRLVKRWGFAATDIRVLKDSAATRTAILRELDALQARSGPGDLVLIYFSGHGTSAQADARNPYDLPTRTGAWLPYDISDMQPAAMREKLIVGRRDLLPRLKQLDEAGRMVVVLNDSCFSGQMVRSSSKRERGVPRYVPIVDTAALTRASAASPGSAPLPPREPPPPYPYKNVLMLSAASDSEAAMDISCPDNRNRCDLLVKEWPTVDGLAHGAFTDTLLRLMDGQLGSAAGALNYAQAREAISQFMNQRGYGHEPQLLPGVGEDNAGLGSQVFLRSTALTDRTVTDRPSTEQTASASSPAPAGSSTVAKDGGVKPAEAGLRVRLDNAPPAVKTRLQNLSGVLALASGPSDLVLGAAPKDSSGKSLQLTTPAGDPVLQAPADDPALWRRISAEAWLQRHLPPQSGSLGLRAETDPGSRGGTFVQCESFAFNIALQQDAYLVLLNLNAHGEFTLLYPASDSELALRRASQPHAIPGTDPKDRIVVIPPFGLDVVTVLALPKPPTFLKGHMNTDPFTADSPQGKALLDKLAAQREGAAVLRLPIRTYAAGQGGGDC